MLPPGYTLRRPTRADARAVSDLFNALDVLEIGEPDTPVEDVIAEWQLPDFELATDAWLVLAPGGEPAGYVRVRGGTEADGIVHPDHAGRGIGGALLELSEERAREQNAAGANPEGRRLRTVVTFQDEPARRLLESRGYSATRYTWDMRIELEEPPAPPEWPEGVSVRTLRPGEERELHALVQEAFGDNADQPYVSFETWRAYMVDTENFDPDFWFVAEANDAIAGVALCPSYPDVGWVRQLAVRGGWRGCGLGLALLRHAFGEFHRHGLPRAGLAVDSDNLTGARRLYERAGMRVFRRYDAYSKSLNP